MSSTCGPLRAFVSEKRRRAIGCSLAWIIIAAAGAARAADRPSVVFDRVLFDRMDQAITKDRQAKLDGGGGLAWGESYTMLAYVEMYRATHDRGYLDKLVDHADYVLQQRNDNRGFRDYSGRIRPAWSVGGKYTVAELTLRTDNGRDVLRFRSTRFAFNDATKIRITTDPGSGLCLAIENGHWKAREEYAGLSLDPDSPDYIERRVNACDRVAGERHLACGEKGSSLVTVEVLNRADRWPTCDGRGDPLHGRSIPMIPLTMAFHGYSGQMTYPMLEFAWVVRQDPALRDTYGRKADEYVAQAVRVYEDATEDWQVGPQPDEGYYLSGEKGSPFWTDGVGKAFNYQCSNGRSLLRLAQLTREPKWERQTKAIARLFKRRLRIADNGSYVWRYGWGVFERGWTREDSPSFNTPTWKGYPTTEDISHGHLDVDFARLCAENGWVFDRGDMCRLANTFLKNVLDEKKWTTANLVDGKGGYGAHNAVIGGWCDLAEWEPKVARAIMKVSAKQRIDERTSAAALWTVARLVRWSESLARCDRPQAGCTSAPATRPR